MTTLTDRYVAAVLRSVPEKTRGDIERELRASIGDATDARLAKGEARDAAEIAVLTELGDPGKMAEGYSGPPRYLIGPSVFHYYVRTLGVVLAFSVPVAWSLVLAIWVAGGASLPGAVVTASLAALFVALLVAFTTTAGYAAVDRWPVEARQEMAAAFGQPQAWTPDRLPASASVRPMRVSESVQQIVGGSIGIACIFIQRSVSPFSDAQGNVIPILNPDLWSSWIPVLVAVAAAWILVEFAWLARGAWSPGLAAILTGISLASAAIYIYLLLTGQLFNTAFFDRLGLRWLIDAGSPVVALAVLLTVIDTGTRALKLWGAPIGKGPGKR